MIKLTKGGRKNNGPAFSAGQWPSLACKAEQKWTALLNVAVALSYVISSPSSIFTGGIVCLKFFSLKNCNYFNKESRKMTLVSTNLLSIIIQYHQILKLHRLLCIHKQNFISYNKQQKQLHHTNNLIQQTKISPTILHHSQKATLFIFSGYILVFNIIK